MNTATTHGYDLTRSSSTLSHLRGASPCSATASDFRFRHRVWAGRSPAELVIKFSSCLIGWRQSSHSSARAAPGSVTGLSTCGGSHPEVFPNIRRQVTALSATAGMHDGLLHSGCAHSSVFPKTNRHVPGDAAAAAITTSVGEPEGQPSAPSPVLERSTLWAKGARKPKAGEQDLTSC